MITRKSEPTIPFLGFRSSDGAAQEQSVIRLRGPSDDRNPKNGIVGSLFPSDHSSMIPRFSAVVTAWVRSFAPSLRRMFLTRLLTVSSEIDS